MGIFDFLTSEETKLENALKQWCDSYERDGLHVSEKVKQMMKASLLSQLHPENYPKQYMTDSVILIETTIRKENGQTSPMDGLNSVDDVLEKAVKEINIDMKDHGVNKDK